MIKKYSAAIFDMDGVLFDTEKLYQENWKEIADERGIVLPSNFVYLISGTSGAYHRQVLEKYYHVEDGEEIVQDCRRRLREKLAVHVPVKPGVREILDHLKSQGIPIAIASSSRIAQIQANLEKSGIGGYFAEIISGGDVENGKPAPDIFLKAAEKLGFAPEECLVFEDSENGVRAGHAAGCTVIMVPDLIPPSEEIKACCACVCESLLEAKKQV